MEIHSANKLNTTTMVSVSYGSDTVRYLFDGNTELKWISVGFSTTLASTTISISFTAATILSHVFLKNHNLQDVTVYYDGTTTNNLFTMTGNSAGNTYIAFNSVTVSSIQIACGKTFVANDTRRIGDLALVEKQFTTEKDPSIRDFPYMVDRFQSIHEMPDGGIAVYNMRDNFAAKIKWKFISSTLYGQFFDLFEDAVPFHVVLRPTSTSWDGGAYEVDWVGAFDFKPSINNVSQGYHGTMDLKQTSRARS